MIPKGVLHIPLKSHAMTETLADQELNHVGDDDNNAEGEVDQF